MTVKSGALATRAAAAMRQARQTAGMTLADLAASTGLSVSLISKLETGAAKISLRHLESIGYALGVQAESFVCEGCSAEQRISADEQALLAAWRSGGAAAVITKALALKG